MILRGAALLMLILLASCGGKQTHGVVDNPYLDRAHDFSMDGMASMQRERWSAAERAFSRALLAAQLSDDTRLVRQSWYNLGVVRSAMHHVDEAGEAFRRCIELSGRQGDDVMRIRAGLALALMQIQMNRAPASIEVPDSGLPADIYLQSGRLAQLQGRTDAAEKAYHSAISKSSRDNQGLKIRADAYMGLALLQHQAGDDAGAKKNVDKALEYCRSIGAPLLTAHALLLRANISKDSIEKKDLLERALAIYTALKDTHGQRETLEGLQKLAENEGDNQTLERIRLRLDGLGAVKPLSLGIDTR